ncbi:MAG: helix-turn-helix transcriptional regulator [Candidatus Paceibacterota bacterium]
MRLGDRIRELRKAKQLTLRQLASRVDVGYTYLSKVENDKLGKGHGPSETLLHRLAIQLDVDESELMALAGKVPRVVYERALARPEAFLAIAELDDVSLDALMRSMSRTTNKARR